MQKFFVFLLLLCIGSQANAEVENGNLDYRSSSNLAPSDYLMGSHGKKRDPVFDEYRTIELNVNLGIGSDCGRISIKNTLQAALKNVLDAKYFGEMGRDILAASPMLLTCYLSPTWCAILKHGQITANFLAQLRLNQCSAIDKYTDMRASDFQEERSSCVQNAIKNNDGNFEEAMEKCKNYWDMDIADWSGKGKTAENHLIESTAKWAGLEGQKAERVVSLTKSLIGDTIIKKGQISVDFGPARIPTSPSMYLRRMKSETYAKLCSGVLQKFVNSGGHKANVHRIITDSDLKEINGDSGDLLVDRQSILSLAYLPFKKRQMACQKLSDAIAMTVFSNDMNSALDFTSMLPNNPNLPAKRQAESAQKRAAFKDQLEMTLALEKQNSEPLNNVLYQINSEGAKYQGMVVEEEMNTDKASQYSKGIENLFFDCADGIGCSADNNL